MTFPARPTSPSKKGSLLSLCTLRWLPVVHSGLCLDIVIVPVYAAEGLFADTLLLYAVVSLPTRLLDLVPNGFTKAYSRSTGQSRPNEKALLRRRPTTLPRTA